MKILSLNSWHGECAPALKDYLADSLDEVDVFCFQETNGITIEQIINELFDESRFTLVTAHKITENGRHYSLHTIVKNSLSTHTSQTLFENNDTDTGQALATTLKINGVAVTIVNVHGIPFSGLSKVDDKLDTKGRLRQTERIITWLNTESSPTSLVCGDFNLSPEAESVKRFADAGYRNLITEYAIQTTRNRLAWERYPDNIQLFADYTFTSPELRVTGFSVPNIEVSDHLPMIIDVDI